MNINMFKLQPNWFDKTSFDFKNGSPYLAEHCSEHFDLWFDKNTFNFKTGSSRLATSCHNHFNKWFDKNTFNYGNGMDGLKGFCREHFDLWFDKNKYDFKQGFYLEQYQHKHFDLWFDKNNFDFKNKSWALVEYCYEHTDKWADKNKQLDWYTRLKSERPNYVKILSLLDKIKTTDKYDLTLLNLLTSEEPNGFINRSLNILKSKQSISG